MNITYKKYSGFTIVELLIVVVVIGILAAITIVSYNGMQERARNTARLSEIKEWKDLFELYYAQNGKYPVVSPGWGNYCLGKGFPTAAEINSWPTYAPQAQIPTTPTPAPDGYCRDLKYYKNLPHNDLNNTLHPTNASLNSQLATVGNLPGTDLHKKLVLDVQWDKVVGPYVTFQASEMYITGIFEGGSCPEGLRLEYPYNSGGKKAVLCELDLELPAVSPGYTN